MTEYVRASSGGKLSVECWGPRDGVPVILMHGTPGSRIGPVPRAQSLHALGVRLISYDRPGYGESSRQSGRSVHHAAGDVKAIADHFDHEQFAVVGRSGGGPHALACAALLPNRVTRAAVLVCMAPPDCEGLDWYSGMGQVNVSEFSGLDQDPTGGLGILIRRAREIQSDPELLLRELQKDLSADDVRIVDDVAIRNLLIESYREGLKHNSDGWLDDALAFRRPWGFDFADIKAPTLLWHGSDDLFSPVAHTRWLARYIPRSESWIEGGAAHFRAVEALPSILAWIAVPKPTTFAALQGHARR